MASRLHRVGVYFGLVDDPELDAQLKARTGNSPPDDSGSDEAPWTRSEIGGLFGLSWVSLVVLSLARSALDWDSRGWTFLIIAGPLTLVFVLAGVRWLVLIGREAIETRGRVLVPDGRYVLVLVGVVAGAFALQKLIG